MDIKDLSKVQKDREAKLKKLRASGFNYPNDFEKKYEISHLINKFGNLSKEDLEKKNVDACNAGRVVLKREMGKVVFMTIEDFSGRIQAYFSKNNLDERLEEIKDFDLGDIIGIEGVLFRTKTDELTIEVKDFKLITKSLNPMPEKHAGLTDIETIYRQRYVDLMSNKDSREIFVKRNKIIQSIRKNLEEAGYLEVETPMMHPIPGGANAKPFKTHHNALDKELFLRIAPELYLKRLLVGGFEKVFEINRNFRNEGLSTIHNPEFTMLEFYEAYGTLKKTTLFVQKLVQDSIKAVNDSLTIMYEEKELDLKNDFDVKSLKDLVKDELKVDLDTEEQIFNAAKNSGIKIKKDWGWGKVLLELFEEHVEKNLWQPTFVKDYPYEVSPLSRKKDGDENYTDRIELFIAGREFANFFCELNDPTDQEERFIQQVKQKDSGDEEAMLYDDDYINALKHGMPPAMGVGLGIDRLVMLATNKSSIRDVVLFPTLK
ncbi:MAG: lysine--tRNA ligase [Pseudomonadota bacterium]|jgi:lysyl-tRNA synthetase class 2|nr:lysine--tRNA ligase [Pseudomonadota bacterium]|tara:strand:- start:7618 stop:9081 length:1464 start_codon:yes stop_codon:yes gene_type:complete